MIRRPPRSTLFPTRRSSDLCSRTDPNSFFSRVAATLGTSISSPRRLGKISVDLGGRRIIRSEEHTSELQSLTNLVCRLLLEKKKIMHLVRMQVESCGRGCNT